MEEIVGYKADIVSLQEVESSVYEQQIKPLFRGIGYESFYCGRGDCAQDWGNVLLFNANKFSCHACRIMRYSEMVPQWCPVGEKATGAFWERLRTQPEGAIIALLSSKVVDRTVCAVATHLFWDPQYPDVKAGQAAILCHQIRKLVDGQAPRGRAPAVVIGGDLNSLWRKTVPDAWDKVLPKVGYLTSGVWELLNSGRLDKTHHDHPFMRRADNLAAAAPFHTHGLQLTSLMMALNGREPPFTNRTATFSGCLDYVWFSHADWTPISQLELPYDDEALDLSGGAAPNASPHRNGVSSSGVTQPSAVAFPAIPNKRFPSDHLPVAGDLLLL